MTHRSWLFLPFLLATACDTNADDIPATRAVYVGSQNAAPGRSGALTRYSVDTGATTELPAFDGQVQSLTVYNGRLYVLLHSADAATTRRGSIHVADLATGERVREIAVDAPRAMAVAGGTGYVSNAYSQSVTPVYLATGQTGPAIAVAEMPEGVAAVGQRVYVANWGNGYYEFLSVVSTESKTETSRVTVCTGPRALLVDDEDEVWVVCTGRRSGSGGVDAGGAVVVVDGPTGEVIARFDSDEVLGTLSGGQDAAFSRTRDELFVAAGNRLLRFNTATNAEAGALDAGDSDAGAVRAVAFDDASGRLFLGRTSVQSPSAPSGVVTVHDPATGAETGRFAAGAVPVAIAFAP